MSGGRSRLHLLDLGSCESDITRTRDGGGGQCLSLAALGNVILALANGAKHVPYRYVSVQHVKYQLNVRYSISRSIKNHRHANLHAHPRVIKPFKLQTV